MGEYRRENIYKRKNRIQDTCFGIELEQRLGRAQWVHGNKTQANGKSQNVFFSNKGGVRTDSCLPSTKWQAEHQGFYIHYLIWFWWPFHEVHIISFISQMRKPSTMGTGRGHSAGVGNDRLMFKSGFQHSWAVTTLGTCLISLCPLL